MVHVYYYYISGKKYWKILGRYMLHNCTVMAITSKHIGVRTG